MNQSGHVHPWVTWGVALALVILSAWSQGAAAQGPVFQHTPQGVSITVHLEFAPQSIELSSAAMRELDQVGRMLNDYILMHRVITILGHENASDYVDVNWDLAKRQAMAVQHYLMTRHMIPETRLMVATKGEGAPLDRDNPRATVNRRIEFLSNE